MIPYTHFPSSEIKEDKESMINKLLCKITDNFTPYWTNSRFDLPWISKLLFLLTVNMSTENNGQPKQ